MIWFVLTKSFDLAVLKPHIVYTQGEFLKKHRFFSVFMRVSLRSSFLKTGRIFLLRMRTVDVVCRIFLTALLLICLGTPGNSEAETNTTGMIEKLPDEKDDSQ
jgi:hypothetical protein